ncbi:NYN domain-containing protein [Planctomycetota bacterium]
MVIVDGYNLLRSLESSSQTDELISDLGMCQILGRYLRQINDTGIVVFDGIGPPDKTGFNGITNLEVLFSGTRHDADTVIEHKIQASTAPKRLIVVSSDRRLRDAARLRKAVTIKSDEFWSEAVKHLRRQKKNKVEPREKFSGLTESETKQWLKLFDLEQ